MFEGELTDISGMTSLSVFFARDNDLSGNIGIFWPLTSLAVVVIDNNKFFGTLDGISALENLSKLLNAVLLI